MFGHGRGQDFASFIAEKGFRSAGADVNAEKMGHGGGPYDWSFVIGHWSFVTCHLSFVKIADNKLPAKRHYWQMTSDQ
jgi:hypothetical protein